MKAKIKDEMVNVRLLPAVAMLLKASLRNLQDRNIFNPSSTSTTHDVELISIVYDAITAANLRHLRGEKP